MNKYSSSFDLLLSGVVIYRIFHSILLPENSLRFVFCISSVCILSILSYSQQHKADSLRTQLESINRQPQSFERDTAFVNSLRYLASELSSDNSDTALLLGMQGLEYARKIKYDIGAGKCYNTLGEIYMNTGDYVASKNYFNKALEIWDRLEKKENPGKTITDNRQAIWSELFALILDNKSSALVNIGVIYYEHGTYPDALEHYLRALKVNEELLELTMSKTGNTKDEIKRIKSGISAKLANIGSVYGGQGDFPKALDYFFKGLKIAEEVNSEKQVAIILGNIGGIYMDQHDYPKALDYYFKTLKMVEKRGNKNQIAVLLTNIGIVYKYQGESAITKHDTAFALTDRFPKSLEHYFKAMKIDEELGDRAGIAADFSNIGGIYAAKGNISSLSTRDTFFTKALEYYFNSLKIAEELGIENGAAMQLGNIGVIYAEQKKYKDAEKYLLQYLAISKKIGSLDDCRVAYQALSNLYQKKGQAFAAFDYYKQYIAARDSIFNEENTKKSVRSEMNFEFEKKETMILAEQEKKNAVAAAESRKQRIILWSVVCGLLLVAVFAGFIYRSLKLTSRQKRIIEKQKQVVDKKNDELAVQKRIVEEKQELLAEALKDLTDSINYASRIQRSLITSEQYLADHLGEMFLFFRPRDIVAGDFYWGVSTKAGFLFATSDCTGHGVPGSMMSMLGISFLNEIVVEKNITSPALVLNELRSMVKKAMGVGKDGMDIALILLSPDRKTLKYAGANNELWIVSIENNLILREVTPDKQPVGSYESEIPFTEHTLRLEKGDMVYTFTDGFGDQFGGHKDKKYKTSTLKKLLQSVAVLPLAEQKTVVEKSFSDWKGTGHQTDDVTLVGIRV